MTPRQLTSKAYFWQLNIFHIGLLSSLVMVTLVSVFVISKTETDIDGGMHALFKYLVPGFSLPMIMVSYIVSNFRLRLAKNQNTLRAKLIIYQSACLIRVAILQGVAMFAVVGHLLTGKLYYLGIAGILIILIVMKWPSRTRTIEELELNQEEIDQINDPNALVAEMAR